MRRMQFRLQTPQALPAADGDGLTPRALLASVDVLFNSPHYRPPMLPAVALKVLELTRTSDVAFDAIVAVIESDPLFTASVLKIAQSAAYASSTPIRSIQQALLRLGLQTLTDICMEAAMTVRVFRAPGFEAPMEAVRRHCVATAHVARMVAQRARVQADSAFTLGLLHDAGLVAGIIALNTPALWPSKFQPSLGWPLLLEVHGELTDRLAALWKLPPDLVEALRSHHRAHKTLDPARACLLAADQLAGEVGFGLPRPTGTSSGHAIEDVELALGYIGLRLGDLPALTADAKRVLSRVF